MATHRIIQGDCLEGLRTLPDASVHCCVTSPPYWGLRNYGHDGQIGLESTPEEYVARMVEVFREVRRVLRDDGTCWVNLGDSYAHSTTVMPTQRGDPHRLGPRNTDPDGGKWNRSVGERQHGLKPKDLVGIPWRVAFALQADGWWLRQDIIWHKPNPMPESVRDRCTKAHEYVFLLTKSQRYFYDADAVSEAASQSSGWAKQRAKGDDTWKYGRAAGGDPNSTNGVGGTLALGTTRNRRSVWTITTKPYSGAHFAVMPPDLVEPCIKAGCPEGGTVLDPFAGSGTTLAVAAQLGRSGIGCELNPEYIELANQRIAKAKAKTPLFAAG
jgi:DNA modification methylase